MPKESITDLIHDTVADDAAGSALSATLAEVTHSDTAWMLIGMQDGSPPAAVCVHGLDADDIARYESELYAFDPWRAVAGDLPTNRPTSLDPYVSKEEYLRSRVYQDLTRGRIDIMHCMCAMFRSGATTSGFAVQRGKQSATYGRNDERKLIPFVSHLERLALTISRRAREPQPDLDDLLPHPDPIIVTDENARPVHCCSRASRLLDSGRVLARTSSGRLRCTEQGVPLEKFIREAALDGLSSLHEVTTRHGTYILSIDRCHGAERQAVLVIRNRFDHGTRKAEQAARRFGLTRTETTLLKALLSGLTVEEYTLAHGTRISTTRSQLHSIFAKSGTERQAELMVAVLEPPTVEEPEAEPVS